MSASPRLLILLAVPAAAAALIAAGSGQAAQAPGSRTLVFKERERGSTFQHIRNTKGAPQRANLAGDVLVITTPLLDGSGKVAGRTAAGCITTTGARDFRKSVMTCHGVVTLKRGTLTFQTSVRPGQEPIVGAVTGGTGDYANARGVFEVAGVVDTITLAP